MSEVVTLVYAGAREIKGHGKRFLYHPVVDGKILTAGDDDVETLYFKRQVLLGMPGMMLTAEKVSEGSYRDFHYLPERWPDAAEAAGWRAREEAEANYARAAKVAAENPLIELLKPLRAVYRETPAPHRGALLAAIIRAITG